MLALLLTLAVPPVQGPDSLTPAARRDLADVRCLSDDARQGRGTKTAVLGRRS